MFKLSEQANKLEQIDKSKLKELDYNNITDEKYRLEAEEHVHERNMRDGGIKLITSNIDKAKGKGQESNTPYGQHLLTKTIQPAAEILDGWIATALEGKAGRRSRAALLLSQVDSRISVFIALKNALEQITMGSSKGKVAEKIGRSIEDELRFQAFDAAMPAYYKRLLASVGRSTRTKGKYRHKRKVLINRMNVKGVSFSKWEENEYINVGIYLLELLRCEEVGLITYTQQKARKRGYLDIVTATAKTMQEIDKYMKRSDVLKPSLQPMICQPADWIGLYTGGYLSPFITNKQFVLTRNNRFKSEIAERVSEMQGVYDAANNVQKTAWRVNKKMYDVVKQVYELDHAIGDLPYKEQQPVMNYPIHIEWKDKDQKRMTAASRKDYKKWKEENPDLARDINIKRGKIRAINAKLISKQLQVDAILGIAHSALERKEIYFVIQCDFRGRFYCASPFLNFQSADYARCMLEFAEGKAIENETAACWFLINGANLFGFDKVSLQDRVEWSEKHKDQIEAVASDPLEHTWWHEADKPFQFLAWCFEVKKFWEEGYGFKSHLPVHLDGSCNAYQHMCALLQDEVGGKAVNLMPSDTPEDVYQIIADFLIQRLKQDGSQLANEWLDLGIDRKATKKVTMTYNYGLTPYSARKYVEEYIEELREKGKKIVWGDDLFMPSRFLANHLWEAIAENIKAAPKLMGWLQEFARLVARNGKSMCWTTPSGFYVKQDYPQLEDRRVKTKIGDSIIAVTTKREGPEGQINRRKQVNSIVANYIHSLDAAALHISVNTAVEYGIKDFALIHDSYGVHAADVELMNEIIRKVFVEMYKREDL